MADSAGVVGQNPFEKKARLDSIANWKYIDKLDELSKFSFSVPNDVYHTANAVPERKAFVPFLKPFRGFITDFAQDETQISMVAKEFAVHLERRVFTDDGEKRQMWTDENWFNVLWLNRILITMNPDDIATELTSVTPRINVTNTAFKNNAKSDGFDFRVTAKDGTTLINHERKTYNGTTGALDLFFEAAKVSESGVTKFYIYFGNPAATDTSTNITDVDTGIVTTLHPQSRYKATASVIAQKILDSANTDMPTNVTWTLSPGFPTTIITVAFNLRNHYQALDEIALILGKDLFFDNKNHVVFIETKGHTFSKDEVMDVVITSKPEKKIENFANIVNILGKKTDDLQIEKIVNTSTVLRNNYEVVVSDSQIGTDGQATDVANTILSEMQVLSPAIKGIVPLTQFLRYGLQSGDIIPLSQPNKNLTGFYRVMDINASKKGVRIGLEDISTGVVRQRSKGLSDTISTILSKLTDSGIESA